MRQENKIIVAIIVGAFIVGIFMYLGSRDNMLIAPRFSSHQQKAEKDNNAISCDVAPKAMVTKVIDGDTLIVEGGWHIRLLGIDTDEKGYPCYNASLLRLEELVLGKEVFLEKEISDVDRYGRCLRTIFQQNQNINVQLVKEGLAVARFYYPDDKYKTEISLAEKEAVKNKIGCKWK